MRDSGIIYRSFYEALKDLPDNIRLEVQDAVFGYMFDQEEPELSGVSKSIWTLIKPQIEANNRKYENGKKGGRPPKNQKDKETKKTKPKPSRNQNKTKPKPKQNQAETKPKPNVNDNVNDNVNVNVNEGEKSKRFSPPTFLEVKNYCTERKNTINPQSFIDFYQSKNWYIGKNKMKDWRAAIRTWEQRSKPNEPIGKKTERKDFV